MKTITTALLFLIQNAFVVAFSEIPFPDDRMMVSRVSDHILLVEVSDMATETEEFNGLKSTIYRVSGKVIEVIRGERPKNWSHTASELEVIDMDAAQKALGDEGPKFLSCGIKFKREGSQCAAGERYLVIYWRGFAFIVQATKTDTEWRSKIRPREPEKWPEDNNDYGFPEWRSETEKKARQAAPSNGNQAAEQAVTPNARPAASSSRHDRCNLNPHSKPRPRSGVGGLDVRQ